MKKLLICLVILLMPILVYSDAALIGTTSYTSDTSSYSDIIFYHDCNALDDANKSGGSATVTYDAGILLETSSPILGTGSWDNNNDSYDNVYFEISGNIDFVSGRVGLYWKPIEAAGGEIVYTVGDDFIVKYQSATQIQVIWGDAADNITINYSTGTAHYIEFEFDGTHCYVHLDGVLKGSVTSSTPVTVDDTYFAVATTSSNAWDAWYDQLISSNDKDRSIYAIRTITNFD